VRGIVRLVLLAPLAVVPLLAWKAGPNLSHLLDFLLDVGWIGRAEATEYGVALLTARNVLFGIAGLDVFASLLAGKGAALHDLLSGTAVFREELVKHKKRPMKERPIHPYVPLFASIVPGLGQLLNGEMGKSIAFFVAMAMTASWDLWPITWAIAAYEAWYTAKQREEKWRRESEQRAAY